MAANHGGRVQSLFEWLGGQVKELPIGTRLPTEGECARRFGISRSTAKRVFGEYRRQGLVYRVRGRGTFVGTEPPVEEPPRVPQRCSAVDELAGQLVSRICSGELRRGHPLPAVTTLSRQLKVLPATVTAAYRRLGAQSYVTKVGKRYWVGRTAAIMRYRTRREVLALTWDTSEYRGIEYDVGWEPTLVRMEAELQDHGFFLRTIDKGELADICRHIARHPPGPHGFFVLSVCAQSSYDHVAGMLKKAYAGPGHTMPPVVMLGVDFTGVAKGFHVVNTGNVATVQARVCARHLFEKDRRRVVLFLEVDDETLTFERLVKVHPEMVNLNPACDFHVVLRAQAPGASKSDILDLARARKGWDWLLSVWGKYRKISKEEIEASFDCTADFRSELHRLQRPSAWIFPTVEPAVEALDWARTNRIRVPRDLSIVAFSDGQLGRERGITCCVPDWDRIGYLMAHAIIGDIPVERSSKGFLRAQARVVERLTA